MNIAIIGSGISGLTCAHLLQRQHTLTVYEASDRIGGHTHTVDVQLGERHYAVDTGFIVFNDWTYPNFIRLLGQVGVKFKPTEMSFSVCDRRSGFEYNGNNLNSLFAQRRNLLSPGFWGMLRDLRRFYREAPALLDGDILPFSSRVQAVNARVQTVSERVNRGRSMRASCANGYPLDNRRRPLGKGLRQDRAARPMRPRRPARPRHPRIRARHRMSRAAPRAAEDPAPSLPHKPRPAWAGQETPPPPSCC